MKMSIPAQTIKQAAHRLIDQLPDGASWKDLMYELSVMQDIDEGMQDSDAGRVLDNASVRKEFGLPE
jgi:predicted transcriptional regulator